jgi:glycerol dehydrogenase-like iron-containing ADH family enzyme
MGYLTGYDDANGEVLEAIRRERFRQEDLKSKGKFAYSCADGGMSNAERLTVLAEELGEVSHEVNEGIGTGRVIDMKKLRKELIEVAAVACAWIEAIDSKKALNKPSTVDPLIGLQPHEGG